MADRELVKIDIPPNIKAEIYGQITSRMAKLGYNPATWDSLNLGFDLPPDWPIDRDDHPTMAQLVVIARKLKMEIVISNICLSPLKDGNPG